MILGEPRAVPRVEGGSERQFFSFFAPCAVPHEQLTGKVNMNTQSSTRIPLVNIVTAALLFAVASAAPLSIMAAESKAVPGHVQVKNVISKAYDRPDAKVVVEPIVASGKFAVVGWTRGDIGGRALFQQNGDEWTLVTYGGDSLKDPLMLEKAGVPKVNAVSISRMIAYAEERETPERVKLFGSFSEGAQPAGEVKK
jgi:hypothetical protein